MNKIFVAYKPIELSSNQFLASIKKRYGVKSGGYSGTLDPFASGVLIIALGQYTKLFRFLNNSPKIYKATLWLGAQSKSLDNKNINSLNILKEYDIKILKNTCESLLGSISYTPPSFSAKKINGIRAYELAKKDIKPNLKLANMHIYDYEILNYSHPFLTIKLVVSPGAYIRSYCELFAKKLNINATLSALERISEGNFVYENEKALNILEYLNIEQNTLKDIQKLENGTKIDIKELKYQKEGYYYIKTDKYFSIISIKNNLVKYELNKIFL